MYGWVVLASLHAECDFYVRLGERPTPPTCDCGLPCKLSVVSKEGPNQGRHYHGCRGQYNACKTFAWAAPVHKGDPNPNPNPSPDPNPNPNLDPNPSPKPSPNSDI